MDNKETNPLKMVTTDLASLWGISNQAVHKYIKEKGLNAQIIGNRSYITPEAARDAMLSRGFKFPHNILSIQMLKGGVGKTTTALNLAIRANMYGAKVLAIDLDQQSNLSFAFGIENAKSPVWADIVEEKVSIQEAIQPLSPTLDIIPSNLNNSVLDRILLNGKRNIALGINQYLQEVKENYELIVIDTAPNLSAINTAAACASTTVILPTNPDKFSFDGLTKTLAELNLLKKEFGVNFQEKVLFTKFDGRETSSREMLKLCFTSYSERMLNVFIRTSTELKNCIRNDHSNIFAHKSTAKEDYDVLTREILGFSS